MPENKVKLLIQGFDVMVSFLSLTRQVIAILLDSRSCSEFEINKYDGFVIANPDPQDVRN